MRGVTGGTLKLGSNLNISTHTPHARRDPLNIRFDTVETSISTHTPHARRDPVKDDDGNVIDIISTHTPHARRDSGSFSRTSSLF